MKTRIVSGMLAVLAGLWITQQAQAYTVKGTAPVGTVTATVSEEVNLTLKIKNISDNAETTALTFPSGYGFMASPQYLDVSFVSTAIGARVIISTDNRSATANPGYCSGRDGIIGTADDENFASLRDAGSPGAGLVGKDAAGHAYTVPVYWVVYDAPVAGGYTFTGDLTKEGVVTDKAQTKAWTVINNVPTLIDQLFDSELGLAYATVIAGMNKDASGNNKGLIASFPADDGTPAKGMRACTSPVSVYLGVNYAGAPSQEYGSNTLKLELIAQ